MFNALQLHCKTSSEIGLKLTKLKCLLLSVCKEKVNTVVEEWNCLKLMLYTLNGKLKTSWTKYINKLKE